MTEYWAHYHDERRKSGQPDEEEFEVDPEDFAAEVAAMEAGEGDWEEVDLSAGKTE